MNTKKNRLLAFLLLVPLAFSYPSGLRAEERPAKKPALEEIPDKDREIIQMLELLELMELLQNMDVVESMENEK
jgi:hypothetical protein